ncbi:MAG: DUF2357 domain-containing protein [Planctomycetes bacterium]|nr:DUF2357 domain-containing protein [Planctomycetota bacterium]
MTRVDIGGTDISLPRCGTLPLQDALPGIRWELPGTGRSTEGVETLKATLVRLDGTRTRIAIDVVGDLVDSSATDQEGAEISTAVRAFLGRHVEAINRACGADGRREWPMAEGCAIVDQRAFTASYGETRYTDEPRLALIVRLALAISGLVADVGCRPRRVLRRVRDQERIERARQRDAACLRWLVRQPGTTLAQRAGPRQRVLSVVREDVVDTMENRVVRDLIDRAVRECALYLGEHRQQPNSFRYRLVQQFKTTCQELRRSSPIAGVPPAAELVRPNYVLQHDERYAPLWTWYLRLRRKQQEQDGIWRWKQRTAAELTQLALMAALQNMEKSSGYAEMGLNGNLYLRAEHASGTFVDERSEVVPRLLRQRDQLRHFTVVPACRLWKWQKAAHLPIDLAALAPDAVIVVHDPCRIHRPQRLLAFWSRISAGEEVDPSTIAAALGPRRDGPPIDAVLLQAGLESDGRTTSTLNADGDGRQPAVRVVELPLEFERAWTYLRGRLALWL